jgi:hypothetical protein
MLITPIPACSRWRCDNVFECDGLIASRARSTSGLWCFQNAAKKTPDLGRPGVFLSPEKSGLTGWRRGAGAAVGVTAGVGAVAEFDALTGAAGVAAATAGFGAAAFGAAGFSPLASSQRQVLLLVWPLRFSLQAWRRQAWQQVWRRLLRQPVWPLVWLQRVWQRPFSPLAWQQV